MGFLGVMSGPLVRSSYKAGQLWAEATAKKGHELTRGLAPVRS